MAALVWMVKGCDQVEMAPSVSVTAHDAVPETGPVEAATPVTVAVTPSALSATVALGSENENDTDETLPPEGEPSAARGWIEAWDFWPTRSESELVEGMVAESPEKRTVIEAVVGRGGGSIAIRIR